MCRRCPRVFTEPWWDGTDETCVFCFLCFVFLSCVCVFPVHTCELCKGRKRKIFHFLRRRSTCFLLYLCRSCEPSIIVSNFVFFRLAASAKSEITAQSTLLSSVSWSFRVRNKFDWARSYGSVRYSQGEARHELLEMLCYFSSLFFVLLS